MGVDILTSGKQESGTALDLRQDTLLMSDDRQREGDSPRSIRRPDAIVVGVSPLHSRDGAAFHDKKVS